MHPQRCTCENWPIKLDKSYVGKKAIRGFSLYEPPLLHRPRFQSEKLAVILDSSVLSNVSLRVSDFLVSLRKRAVLLARPPHFGHVVIQLDPEQANLLIPDSDKSGPVFGIGSFEKDVPAEVLPWTDAGEPKLPTLIQVPFASLLRNSAVTLVSRLRRYCNRRVETSETVNQ